MGSRGSDINGRQVPLTGPSSKAPDEICRVRGKGQRGKVREGKGGGREEEGRREGGGRKKGSNSRKL